MEIQDVAEILMNNLNPVSIGIIAITVGIFLIAVIINFAVAKKYKKLIKELEETNYEGMEIYKGKILNSVVSAYKETYQKSKDFVNTQAIIESKFFASNSMLLAQEKFLSTVTTMIVTLGISGSLNGIICIVTRLNALFAQANSLDITDMRAVYGNMAVILAYLAVAFVTAFVSIICAFIYSLITSMTNIEILRGNFFARLEDYLDNELGSTLSLKKNENTINNAQNGNITGDNSNILYMLENTSHSMMTSTSKLETTIAKLNESLIEMLGNDDMDLLEKKLQTESKKEKQKTITLQKSKEIIKQQYENKEKLNAKEVIDNIVQETKVDNNSNFVDPINTATINNDVNSTVETNVMSTEPVQPKVGDNASIEQNVPTPAAAPMLEQAPAQEVTPVVNPVVENNSNTNNFQVDGMVLPAREPVNNIQYSQPVQPTPIQQNIVVDEMGLPVREPVNNIQYSQPTAPIQPTIPTSQPGMPN